VAGAYDADDRYVIVVPERPARTKGVSLFDVDNDLPLCEESFVCQLSVSRSV
jgi:hypothetical protein